MSYYPIDRRAGGGDNDDFNDVDPITYQGGYDISLIYGRGLPPSLETCYPRSSTSDYFDYSHRRYASHTNPSAYTEEAINKEYQSYGRPKPLSPRTSGFNLPRPNFGFQPGAGPPDLFGSSDYGRIKPEYGYGPKPVGSDFGYPSGKVTEFENRGLIQRQEHEKAWSGDSWDFSPRHGRRSGDGFGGSSERSEYRMEKMSHAMPSYPAPAPPNFPMPNYHGPPPPPSSYPENLWSPGHGSRDHEKYGYKDEEKWEHNRHRHQ